MKNITKKQGQTFNEEVTKGLLEVGATMTERSLSDTIFTTFTLSTIVGTLVINLPKVQGICYTVFSSFDNVAKAKNKFTCNPYSGKYNVHIGTTVTTEKAIEMALMTFEGTQEN